MRAPLLTLLILTVVSAHAAAAPVTVVNAGFEDDYVTGNLPGSFMGDVPPTAFPVGGAPNGWEPYGAVGGNAFIGVLNPGIQAEIPEATYFPAGAPEGDNVALAFFGEFQGGGEFGIQQTLTATLQADVLYTLSVQVGNIASGISIVEPFSGFGYFDLRGFPGYRIDFMAGNTMLVQDIDSLLPDEGEFLLSTIRVAVDDEHEALGQQLRIRLVNLNQQDVNDPVVDLEVDFDDIQLDATPLAEADFDRDGDVDASDLVTWEAAYGATDAADTDDDGDSDGIDFLRWQQQYTGALDAIQTVPEPTAVVLAGGAVLASMRRGRRIVLA